MRVRSFSIGFLETFTSHFWKKFLQLLYHFERIATTQKKQTSIFKRPTRNAKHETPNTRLKTLVTLAHFSHFAECSYPNTSFILLKNPLWFLSGLGSKLGEDARFSMMAFSSLLRFCGVQTLIFTSKSPFP